jgi:hypothetical protein
MSHERTKGIINLLREQTRLSTDLCAEQSALGFEQVKDRYGVTWNARRFAKSSRRCPDSIGL